MTKATFTATPNSKCLTFYFLHFISPTGLHPAGEETCKKPWTVCTIYIYCPKPLQNSSCFLSSQQRPLTTRLASQSCPLHHCHVQHRNGLNGQLSSIKRASRAWPTQQQQVQARPDSRKTTTQTQPIDKPGRLHRIWQARPRTSPCVVFLASSCCTRMLTLIK